MDDQPNGGARPHLRAREPALAAIGVAIAVAYQASWYLAPDLLRIRLFPGGTIPLSYVLFLGAIVAPIVLAWLCVRQDDATDQ